MEDHERTASLMTPAKLAQVKPKAPLNPAAWLDQMASDAGHAHVARLGELVRDLLSQGRRRDFAPMADHLSDFAAALPQLDFGLLEAKGLLARLSGKTKSAGAGFASQVEQIEGVVQGVARQVQALQNRQAEQASGTDLALLEFEVEFRAVEKIIDQGARWLQDMRNQLKARDAAAAGNESERLKIRQDAARCELLVARLKLLRSLCSAAQQAHQQAQSTAARRDALVQLLQQVLATNLKDWRTRMAGLSQAVAEGRAPGGVEGAMESHRDLQLGIKQAIADCGQVQAHEKALAESLEALAMQLRDAAPGT